MIHHDGGGDGISRKKWPRTRKTGIHDFSKRWGSILMIVVTSYVEARVTCSVPVTGTR
jgi:hypothetical protein